MASAAEGEMSGSTGQEARGDAREEAADRANGGKRAYHLVLWMLAALSVVMVLSLSAPLLLDRWVWSDAKDSTQEALSMREKRMTAYFEFYKWGLSVLVGAFGAWIGAGAAYFFGRENLKESSDSTERALRIQKGGDRRVERIGDLMLTGMNKEFLFHATDPVEKVLEGLNAHRGYWFVPVLDEAKKGTVADVVHARLFWAEPKAEGAGTIKQLLEKVDAGKDEKSKKLHGDPFFLQVSPDDRPKEVLARMDDRNLAVGIVVDGKSRPTHCFTQMELSTFLNTKA